jgi:hypothetical protein
MNGAAAGGSTREAEREARLAFLRCCLLLHPVYRIYGGGMQLIKGVGKRRKARLGCGVPLAPPPPPPPLNPGSCS